jgi:uncharacterized protein
MQPLGRTARSVTILGMAIAFASSALAGCGDGNSASRVGDAVRVKVAAVGFDDNGSAPYVQLDDRAGQRSLQIVIGGAEARAILLELHGIKSARPLSDELLASIIARTGNTVDRVEVSELHDQIYYAKIILDHGRYAIDCRPSDAIALALQVGAPIYVAGALMQSHRVSSAEVPVPATATNFGITVQELTPDLAQYFGVTAGSGVVVADFDRTAGSVGVQRGDIIVAAGGRPVRTVAEFTHVASPGPSPIALTVRRGGATLTITIAPAVKAGAAG